MPYLIAIFLLFLFLSKKKTGTSAQPVPGSYGSAIYSYIAEKEGGLAVSAPDASVGGYSTCIINHHGHTYNNPSVSRGVTWGTFLNLAPVLNYEPSCTLFAALSDTPPNEVWFQIVAHYLDKGKPYSNNQVLADYIGLWYWGGWAQSLLSRDTVLAVTNGNASNKNKLRSLVQLRQQYFTDLVAAKPNLTPYLSGWLNNQEIFFQTFSKFL